MSSEFDDFADLWRQEPSPDEQRAFVASVERSRRRAKLIDRAELGLAGLLVLAVIGLLILTPRPATLIVGTIAVAGLTWSSWKRHLLRQVGAAVAEKTNDDYVAIAIAEVEATRARARTALILFWPLALAGSLLGLSLRQEGDLRGFAEQAWRQITEQPSGPILAVALVGLYAWMVRSFLRSRSELRRLYLLRDQYRAERSHEEDMLP